MKADDRVEVRVPKSLKARIEKAAALAGQSVSAFVLSSAAEKADAVFQRHLRRELSERDARAFLRLLDDAAEPNARMRAAAKRFKDWDAKKRK